MSSLEIKVEEAIQASLVVLVVVRRPAASFFASTVAFRALSTPFLEVRFVNAVRTHVDIELFICDKPENDAFCPVGQLMFKNMALLLFWAAAMQVALMLLTWLLDIPVSFIILDFDSVVALLPKALRISGNIPAVASIADPAIEAADTSFGGLAFSSQKLLVLLTSSDERGGMFVL
jgi:hypothetical protein